MRVWNIGAARDEVDEVELAEAAIFSLNQAARRLRTLADQAQSQDLRAQLQTLAEVIDDHANRLTARRPMPA
jgi:rubrerythrin